MNLFWFLPTHGDGAYLGSTTGARPVTFAYLRQIAQAADDLGYAGVLLPTGSAVKTRGSPLPLWCRKGVPALERRATRVLDEAVGLGIRRELSAKGESLNANV